MKKMLLSLLLSISFCIQASLPEISKQDVKKITNEIVQAHVTYNQLSPELMRRSIKLFIDNLDPSKTYFIKGDIQDYLDPSQEMSVQALNEFENLEYSIFETLFTKYQNAIERRRNLEQAMTLEDLKKDANTDQLRDLDWAENEESYLERLVLIKSIQKDLADQLDLEAKEIAIERLARTRKNIENTYLSEVELDNTRKMYALILKSIAASLDSQTAYFTPDEASQFMSLVQQKLFGIGVQLRDDLQGLTVMSIIDGGPVSRGKELKIKDRIIAVDGHSIVGMNSYDAVNLIRGEKGTPVKLTVLRETKAKEAESANSEEKLLVNIVRGEIIFEEGRLKAEIEPYGDGVIAHLSLYTFYQDSKNSLTKDIYAALQEIKEKYSLKGVVLDLRRNTGGVLTQAANAAGLFINKGIVVTIKLPDGRLQHLRDVDGRTVWSGPLVVLTSRLSASASEILAQTLKDYGRAIIVGDTSSFGKGSFQYVTFSGADNGKINPKGEYKVTKGLYYTVSGYSPQLTGVKADIVVPGVFSSMDLGEQFSKYPLEGDNIEPNFNDDLSDIPYLQRDKVARLYRFNLQKKIDTYTRHIPNLQTNSQLRIEQNASYQKFLGELTKDDDIDMEVVEKYDINDLQLSEAMNVLKDLVFLYELDHREVITSQFVGTAKQNALSTAE